MKDKRFSLKMNRDGELIQEHLHDITRDKYKPDSVFLTEIVSCGLMLCCIDDCDSGCRAGFCSGRGRCLCRDFGKTYKTGT